MSKPQSPEGVFLDGVPLPLVDVQDPGAAEAIRAACLEHGFFYVTNHGIPEDVIEHQFQQSKAFFALPEEEKQKVKANAKARGYTSETYQTLDPKHSTKPDALEGFWAWTPEVPEDSPEAEIPYAGANLWPDPKLLPGFRQTLTDYMDRSLQLSNRVRKLVAQALQLPTDYFERSFQHNMHQLRLMHYSSEASDPEKGTFGAGAHTDFSFITYLVGDGNPGLQLFYKGKWWDVPTVPHTFIVNLGDMLQFWSNGVFHSTRHRVVKPAGDRYSCAFFVSADHDAMIECLPTCIDGKEKNEPTTVSNFLAMKFQQMLDEQPERVGLNGEAAEHAKDVRKPAAPAA